MNATLQYAERDVTFYDVDPASHIGNCLLNVGPYEHPNLQYISSLYVEGNYADVGAHIGTHALWFAFACPSRAVYAFEPKKKYLTQLVTNVIANRAKNVYCYEVALAEADGISLPVDEGEPWEVRSLDSYKLQDVRLLKIDVESSELRVLQGAKETLKTVEHLFLEVWTDEVYAKRVEKSPMADIVAFLEPYKIVPVRELEQENLWHFKRS